MDSKEHYEIQEARRLGNPQTDEGPYYHDTQWESYKGGVKGKLGGAIIGAGLGAAAGVIAAVAIPFVGGALLGTTALALTISGFTAAGMAYGAHEFSEVGHITGAVAAAHEKSEERMKEYSDSKFDALSKKIDTLRSNLTGEPVPEEPKTPEDNKEGKLREGLDYTTTHCDEHCSPHNGTKLIFWKVALIGLLVGAAAGAILATGGIAGHALAMLGVAGEGGVLSTTGVLAASTLTMGLFGASFGVNRDMFRHVFDRTDLMFRGIIGKEKGNEPTVIIPSRLPEAPAPAKQEAQSPDKTDEIVSYQASIDYPDSKTYHRDKVMASAKQALLDMDHNKAIRH
jgi:hypothetical protein